jgi:ubiquinone/menaquinone biosynthesis C-methylase UbiE
MEAKPTGAGSSSFDLVDAAKLFLELALGAGDVFLDLGSGAGAYALKAAEYVGDEGAIYAVDLWEEGIAALRSEAEARGIGNLRAKQADISKRIPLPSGSVDVGLLSTVLHDLVRDRTQAGTLGETRRVLRPGGKLAVVEFKRVAGPPGPPVGIRLAPAEVCALLRPHGFDLARIVEVGPHLCLSLFLVANGSGH